MDLKEYEHYADACFRDTPAPCASVCPFDLDVREFVKHLQKGNYRGAYRTYQKAVLFPQIVSSLCTAPCQGACVRSRYESPIALKGLEQTCIEKMPNLQPTRYSRMKKSKTVAVIGGGLAGLAFAYRMSSWGYPVKVYEQSDVLGGSALRKMDPEVCSGEINREFGVLDCQFVTGRKIETLSELTEDAVFIATGRNGNAFGETERSGIYRGGQLMGASGVESIVQGLQAARAADNAFRSGREESFAPVSTVSAPDPRYYDLPYDYEARTHQEGKGEAEAGRCMLCNCSLCYDVCPVMQQDKRYPKRMCSEIIVTLKPNMSRRTGVRMVNNCTYCGACAEVCPTGVDMGKCLEFARKDFYDSGAMAPGFHDYWMQDLDFSLSGEAYLVHQVRPGESSDILFFPGCQLGASDPQYVMGTLELLKKKAENPALYLSCCGLPARWAGQEEKQKQVAARIREEWLRLGRPVFITACTSCLSNLRREIPEMEVISLYSWLAEHPDVLPFAEGKGTLQVLDPCASAKDVQTQGHIRSILRSCGYTPENEEANTGCCGFGGHMYAVDPKLFGTFADRRTQDIREHAITYCANCRDIFSARGTDCRHILDLVLGLEEGNRKPPELEERRNNRRKLRYHYAGKEYHMEERYPLTIPDSLLEKMNAQMLLRSQVETVVRTAEETGTMVLDEAQGIYYGHGRFGSVTIWAAWRRTDAGAELCNVYSHRVVVKEVL